MAIPSSAQRPRAPAPSSPGSRPPARGADAGAGEPPKRNIPPRRTWITFLLVLAVNFLLVRLLLPSSEPVKVPYTLFREQVGKRNVEAIYSRGASITGRFAAPVTYPRDSTAPPRGRSRGRPRPVTDFATELPAFADPGLEALLIANGVEISAEADPGGRLAQSALQLRARAHDHRALRLDVPARREGGRRDRRYAHRRPRPEHRTPIRSADGRQGHLR